jgi:hypothetical protein
MYAIAATLAVLWVIGLVCGFTTGGAIHLLLIIAIVLFLVKRMGDRKRSHRSDQQAQSRQLRHDVGSPKTWNLK